MTSIGSRPIFLDLRSRIVLSATMLAMVSFCCSAQTTGTLYGTSGVTPDAVKQGTLGSCYFHASIAALAGTYPNVLRNDISGNGKQGYSVTFSEGATETVFQEDIDYGRQNGFDSSDGDWVLVLARGYAQRMLRKDLSTAIQNSTTLPAFSKSMAVSALENSGQLILAYDRAIRAVVQQDGTMSQDAFKAQLNTYLKQLNVPSATASMLTSFLDQSGFYAALDESIKSNGDLFGAYRALGQGGVPERVMDAFLGKGHAMSTNVGTAGANAHLLKALANVHANQSAMVAWTDESEKKVDDSIRQEPWWVTAHAYSVLQYDPESQTVHLRNPWGSHPAPNGEFDLPLSEFISAYAAYSISKPQ